MTQTMDSSIKFWNKKAESYAKQAISEPEAYEKKLAFTREHLNPQSRVLEFGCGTGSTALLHAPHVQHIVAVDSSAKMIEIATALAREKGVANVDFQQTTLLDLPLPEEPYNVILGLSILHLLDNLHETIERCYQLLAPGGVFVSNTACIANAGFLIRSLLPIGGKLGLIPRVTIFSVETLESSLKRAGFEIVKSELLNKNGLTSFIIARK